MNNNNPSTEETLRKELGALGAREFEVVALTMDPERGLAALHYAQTKGVDYPLSYAIKVFDNPDWFPKGETRRLVTNAHVDRKCDACGGHLFVVVTDDVTALYGETYAPCAACNSSANTVRYSPMGDMLKTAPR
jgi:hypothetical protein